jgi:hypothetical protein
MFRFSRTASSAAASTASLAQQHVDNPSMDAAIERGAMAVTPSRESA